MGECSATECRGVNVWGCVGGGGGGGGGGGWFTPQINDPVGLKLRAVGLKIMRLFTITCSALRSKLNIFETRDRLRLLSIEMEICSNGSNSSEII
jgi:hypothetical protein